MVYQFNPDILRLDRPLAIPATRHVERRRIVASCRCVQMWEAVLLDSGSDAFF